MTTQHADMSPSSASRWLSCPGSIEYVKLFPNETNQWAELGTVAHKLLEDCLTFDTKPMSHDDEMNECVQFAIDTVLEYAADGELYLEQKLTIPETGEWGTTDICIVNDKMIHVIDYKHGYGIVDVKRNPQLLLYLYGAIHKYGERKQYRVSVIQPRASHIEGPVRSWQPGVDDLEWLRMEVKYALENRGTKFFAGKHCKYCPAAGGCKDLAAWAAKNAGTAIMLDVTGLQALSNETLAQLNDFGDLLPGLVKEWRAEAMRRIMQYDKHIPGYKVTKGRETREFKSEQDAIKAAQGLALDKDMLYNQSFVTVKQLEDMVKAKFRGKRGEWSKRWQEHIAPAVAIKSSGLTLEKETDGRPAWKRGDEFTNLPLDNETSGDMIL